MGNFCTIQKREGMRTVLASLDNGMALAFSSNTQ